MHIRSTNEISSSIGYVLVPLSLCLLAGCNVTPPAKVASLPSHVIESHLFQLSDDDWVDLSDIREIQFQRNDMSKSPNADPFYINLWRNGSESPFTFTFADAPSAYAAWKRLVAHLGGSLKQSQWDKPTATSRPVVEVTPPLPAATQPSQSLFQNQTTFQSNSDPYAALKQGLLDLASCRDAKLITDAEYQRGRDATLAAFKTQVAEGGSGFQTAFDQMHFELIQLEQMKKDHLLSDEQIAPMREKIVTRYGLTPVQTP